MIDGLFLKVAPSITTPHVTVQVNQMLVERPPAGIQNHHPALASRAQPSGRCQRRCSLATRCVLMIIIRSRKQLDPCRALWKTPGTSLTCGILVHVVCKMCHCTMLQF